MYFKYHNYYSSKATISVNFSDDGRSFAISTNGVSSGMNVPQLATKFDGDKFGFTGEKVSKEILQYLKTI